jgi:glycosyltransferase involved in cell wall biosynthesis
MKIFIIGPLKGFNAPVIGGPERVFKNQILGFTKYGASYEVVAFLLGFKESLLASLKNIMLYPNRYNIDKKPIFSAEWLYTRRKASQVIRMENPDIIILHDPSYIILLPRNVKKLVTILHGPFWEQNLVIYPRISDIPKLSYRYFIYNKINAMGQMFSEYIICVTEYLRKTLPKNLRSKALVLENPVDDIFFTIKKERDNSKDKDKLTLLSVGRISPVKGYEVLIYAIKNFLKIDKSFADKIQLRIVAPCQNSFNWYYKKLVQLVKKFDLNNIVNIVTTLIDDNTLLEEYRRADIYMHSSFSEGLPNSIQEAMASGLPVIASKVGGIPMVIQEGYNGFLFNAGNYKAITKYLLELITDSSYRLKLGENARMSARYRWSLSHYVAKLCLSFEKINV